MKLSNATDPRVSTSQHDLHQFRFRNKGRPADVCKQDLTFHLPGYEESNCCVYRARLLRQISTLLHATRKVYITRSRVETYLARTPKPRTWQCSKFEFERHLFPRKSNQTMLCNVNSKYTSYRYIVGSWLNVSFASRPSPLPIRHCSEVYFANSTSNLNLFLNLLSFDVASDERNCMHLMQCIQQDRNVIGDLID